MQLSGDELYLLLYLDPIWTLPLPSHAHPARRIMRARPWRHYRLAWARFAFSWPPYGKGGRAGDDGSYPGSLSLSLSLPSEAPVCAHTLFHSSGEANRTRQKARTSGFARCAASITETPLKARHAERETMQGYACPAGMQLVQVTGVHIQTVERD